MTSRPSWSCIWPARLAVFADRGKSKRCNYHIEIDDEILDAVDKATAKWTKQPRPKNATPARANRTARLSKSKRVYAKAAVFAAYPLPTPRSATAGSSRQRPADLLRMRNEVQEKTGKPLGDGI